MTLYLLLALLLAITAWIAYNYWRINKAAKVLDNEDFARLIPKGQLIDLRPTAEFQRKHITGARNFPKESFKQSLTALRKNKPVLLYDNMRGAAVSNAALLLKKNGFEQVYILKYGLDYWDGKLKGQGPF